jgi:hypothetical protein
VVAGTTGEGACLASFRFVGVCAANHCVGGQDRTGRSSCLCSLVRRGLSHPLCWRSLQFKALLWHLIVWSSWAQPATVVASTTVDGAALASLRSVGVGSASHCVGGHLSLKHCSCLFSLGRRGLIQLLWWRLRKMMALLSPLFARSAWAQPATVLAVSSV